MKIYNTDISFQSFGEVLTIIIRGHENDIQETYNGFYNLGATPSFVKRAKKGKPLNERESAFSDYMREKRNSVEFTNHSRTIGTFLSSPDKMRRFFSNKVYHKNWESWRKSFKGKAGGIKSQNESEFEKACDLEADKLMGEFAESQETFFNPSKSASLPHLYSMANHIEASKPDDDFRDLIVKSAFSCGETNGKVSEKDLDKSEVEV